MRANGKYGGVAFLPAQPHIIRRLERKIYVYFPVSAGAFTAAGHNDNYYEGADCGRQEPLTAAIAIHFLLIHYYCNYSLRIQIEYSIFISSSCAGAFAMLHSVLPMTQAALKLPAFCIT